MEMLGLPLARRIAIAATGLAEPRPDDSSGAVTARHIRRTIARTLLLQIDSVSVLVRAHYLPLFSRLGPYDTTLLEREAWGGRRSLFEYWVHEASLVPLDSHPLLRWRMARAAEGQGIYGELARLGREERPFIETLLREIAARGPTPASAFEDERAGGGWWGWSRTKRALEWLFWAGRLTAATRRGFERVYDLPERTLPAELLSRPTPAEPDAIRALLAQAGRALGIATAGDLRDYHRLSPADAHPRIAELVEAGVLRPVVVEGWRQQAYLHAEARRPRRVAAAALVSPFDPLVWHRPRTERLFGFDYRIEIYTPAARRQHGYYVLPFLHRDRLAARVDLKAERARATLQVLAAYAEDHAPPDTAEALAAELVTLAGWLGLAHIVVTPRGDLAPRLADVLSALREPDPSLRGTGAAAERLP